MTREGAVLMWRRLTIINYQKLVSVRPRAYLPCIDVACKAPP